MINCCFKDPLHVLMRVLLSIDDDDDEEVVNHVDGHVNDVREGEEDGIVVEDSKEEEGQSVGDTLILKSSLRKFNSNSNSMETEKKEKEKKKKVQWVDVMGIKELADIREFEPSEEDDIDSDRGKACVCVIL